MVHQQSKSRTNKRKTAQSTRFNTLGNTQNIAPQDYSANENFLTLNQPPQRVASNKPPARGGSSQRKQLRNVSMSQVQTNNT